MTIENGLDTPDTAELERIVTTEGCDPRVAAYVRLVRSQSIGWMVHDKVICNLLRVSQFILRKIKAAVAKLPGVRKVRYKNHRGLEYDGLLIGDHAEGEGYDIIGWYDAGRYVKGEPPMVVPPLDIPPLPSTDTPRRAAKREKQSPSPGLGQDNGGAAEPSGAERVTPGNSARRVVLAEMRQKDPSLAPGCAVLDGILDHRNVPLRPGHWQGNIESYVGAFTAVEAYAAVEHVASHSQPFTPETVADAIRLGRR